MKITFVTSTLHSGGSERVMALLANSFCEKGYDVEIVCINKHLVFYPLLGDVKVYFAEDEVGNSYLRKTIWLRKHIKNEKPDVVIAFMLEVFCMTLFALIGVDVPVISSERIDPHFFGKVKGFMRWVLLRRTTHLVVQTQQIKSFYSKSLQQRTTIIPNPVTDKVFDIKPVPKKNRLIAVGRLAYQKNYPMMFKTFKQVLKEHPSYELVVFGDGPQKSEIEQFVLQEGLENKVLLKGKTDKILEELNCSKLFVMTSDYEGMSNAMLEALCIGLPVVTTDVSGASDIIKDGENGYIIRRGHVDEFAEALCGLLSNESLMERMGARNRQKAKLFQREQIVNQWEKLVLKISNSK